MNFLKKHYEKVLLFALFVIFAILLVHLFVILQSTREVKDEHLEIPTREPDYMIADAKSDMFNIPKLLISNITFPTIGPRDNKNNKDYSDLINIFKIVRCGKCQYLIPRRVMENNEKCFHCQEKLMPPKKEEAGTKIAARLDHDDDGIPNVVELLFGLDPYNANDALLDLDGDGFANVYEYMILQDTEDFKKIFSADAKNISNDEIKNMALKNPKVHPELATGLFVEKIDRQKLNVKLLGTTPIEGMSKEIWNIQIEVSEHPNAKKLKKRDRRKLEKVDRNFKYIGQKINLVMGAYTVHDIRADKNAVVNNKKTMAAKDNDQKLDKSYYVELRDSKDRPIIMKVDSDTYDLEDEVIFGDVWSNKKYSGKVGDTIEMGDTTIGKTSYKIKSIDKNTNSAILERKGMKDMQIKRTPIMPKEFVPLKIKQEEKSDAVPENRPQI